jgi:hypothetical protein
LELIGRLLPVVSWFNVTFAPSYVKNKGIKGNKKDAVLERLSENGNS